MLLEISRVKANADPSKGDHFEVYVAPSPLICTQSTEADSTINAFCCASLLCRTVSAASVLGGIATIALVETSDASSGTKTAVSILGGLLLLSSYYSYRLGKAYRIGWLTMSAASEHAAQRVRQNNPLHHEYSKL